MDDHSGQTNYRQTNHSHPKILRPHCHADNDGKNDIGRILSVSAQPSETRTIPSAPTRLNARATLSPMTCVTKAINIESNTSVVLKEGSRSSGRRVRL